MNDKQLMSRGLRYPTAVLLEQAPVIIALADKYSGELKRRDWTPERTKGAREIVERLVNLVARNSKSRSNKLKVARNEVDARSAAKTFIDDLRVAVADVAEDGVEVDLDAFKLKASMRDHTRNQLNWLDRVADHVAPLDKDLKGHFDGKKASELLAKVRDALAEADEVQENTLTALPLDTAEVTLVKGALVRELDRLRRDAKRAFVSKPKIAKRFELKIAKRAKRPAKKKTKNDPKPA